MEAPPRVVVPPANIKERLCMFHFKRKSSAPRRTYDPAEKKPVIRASICTGEKVAGFKDLRTGAFHEVMLIRSQGDLDEFMEQYGVDRIETEY